eukprot:COSAG05_NODE_2952_length_2472_cov_2.433628_3_plen_79_part_00
MEEGYRQQAFDKNALIKQLPKASRDQLQKFTYASMTWHVPLFWRDMIGGELDRVERDDSTRSGILEKSLQGVKKFARR